MFSYTTFVVVDCKARSIILVTSSARNAGAFLRKGIRIEVWNNNTRIETIYDSTRKQERNPLGPYIEMEREYIRKKQAKAEQRNRRRRNKKNGIE